MNDRDKTVHWKMFNIKNTVGLSAFELMFPLKTSPGNNITFGHYLQE